MGRLEGRRAIVTGASRGIGAAVTERLVAEGAGVVITARTLEEHDHLEGSLRATAQRCARYGTSVVPLAADLSEEGDRARIVPTAAEALGGPVDILVNNAAAGIHRPSASMSLRHRRIMFEVNVQAPIDLAQAAIPAMQERGEGWIVNISSGSALTVSGPPFPDSPMGTTNAAYGATKAALNRYTNALGIELHGTGIRINTLEPVRPVASEGAMAHLGERIPADMFNPVEVIVEATLALSTCDTELTGRICVDGPLLDELGIAVRTLDGTRPLKSPLP